MTDSFDSYRDERARFYDELLADQDRPDDDYYVETATAADGPVLEAACGTGRIYLELLAAGVDADGFDLSREALTVLRENAEARGLEPTVWEDDLTAVETDRSYALATCPFNAVQHLPTIDDQLAALDAIYETLQPDGRFVFDVFVPRFDVICETYGEWRVETVDYRGAPHEVRTRPRIVDEVEQRFAVETELYDPDGELVFAEEDQLSMLPKRQVELLARQSSFESWSATGDFTDEPLEDGHGIQVWELTKSD